MSSKKLINDPEQAPVEATEGYVALSRGRVRQVPGMTVVARTDMPIQGRVGVVIGGGSGHEPLFLEFVGKGMADAAAAGAVFTSPGPDLILEATRQVHGGAGVVYIFGNYAGDNMNFDLAAELAAAEGIETRIVRVWDDIASAPPERYDDRRGTAADLFVIKIAGAAAERGMNLDEVHRLACKTRDRCRSLGVALSSCTLPGMKKSIFEIGDDEMMVGMGLHGEPGMERRNLLSADEAAQVMLEPLLKELDLKGGDEVGLLVNGYGSTTRLELNIMARAAAFILKERGIALYDGVVGNFCTSLEMAGCSFTLLHLDEELKDLWDDPAWSSGFSKPDTHQ